MGLPFHAGPSGFLQVSSMVVLAIGLCSQNNSKQAFYWGWIYQTTAFIGTFWWIYISLHVYGEMPAWLALSAVLLLSALLALYWAVMAGYFHVVFSQGTMSRFRLIRTSLLFAVCWMMCELARGVWFTGFPWGSSGYAHTLTALSALAPFMGVYGIGAVSAGLSMALVLGWANAWSKSNTNHRLLKASWVVFAMMMLALTLIPLREKGVLEAGVQTPQPGALQIALLQGNVPQESKFSSARREASEWYTHELLNQKADLVITPETAFAQVAQSMPESFWGALMQHAQNTKSAMLLGMPLSDANGFTNSALGIGPNQSVLYRYDKAHLVPFGEFLPPFFKWFTDQMKMPLGFFRFGDEVQESMSVGKERVAPNICYEDLFGEELAKRFLMPDKAPTLMVNMSNIAWFGDTVVVDQHLEISRMRTLELERPMIRSTNSGATAVIDEKGQLLAKLKNFERGVLNYEIKGVESEPTFFAWWAARFGLWPFWLLAVLVGLIEGLIVMRQRGMLKI
jgi:apolipoprotein N-acyltransferase